MPEQMVRTKLCQRPGPFVNGERPSGPTPMPGSVTVRPSILQCDSQGNADSGGTRYARLRLTRLRRLDGTRFARSKQGWLDPCKLLCEAPVSSGTGSSISGGVVAATAGTRRLRQHVARGPVGCGARPVPLACLRSQRGASRPMRRNTCSLTPREPHPAPKVITYSTRRLVQVLV